MSEEAQPPSVLYHYTGIEAFRRILDFRKIRATRYNQMDDESELQIGVERLIEVVEDYQPGDGSCEYKEYLLSGLSEFKKDEGLEVYILSLSAAADSLEQWRAYAPHGGVAIGFDSQKVLKGFLCHAGQHVGDLKNRLLHCVYTDRNGQLNPEQRKRVTERFFKDDTYAKLGERPEPLAQQVFLASLSVEIYRTICRIKNGAYAQEQEWRCVNIQPDQNDYPVKLSEKNKWYIEMSFDPKDYIKEVWISPNGDKQSYERAISYFIRRDNLPLVIQKSTIPFRG